MSYTCPRCNGSKNVWKMSDKGVGSWALCPLCVGRGCLSEQEHLAVNKIIAAVEKNVSKVADRLDAYAKRKAIK